MVRAHIESKGSLCRSGLQMPIDLAPFRPSGETLDAYSPRVGLGKVRPLRL